MTKDLNLDEIREYLQILSETVAEHDESCEICVDHTKAADCELYRTITTEIERISYKLHLNVR